MPGFIKLYRKITEWEWYKDTATRGVFLHLLLNATHEAKVYRGQQLNVGDCVFGRKKFSAELGLGEQQIRTAIRHLILTGEITINPTNKLTNQFTIINVVNYAKYHVQCDDANQRTNQQIPNQSPTDNHIQEVKKLRNKESITIAPSDSHSMPNETPIITIQLNDGTEYPIYQKQVDEFKSIYPSVNIEQQLRSMKGWAISNPTKRKTSRGIMKFINNWLSREQDKAPAPKSNNPYEGMRQL